MPGSSTRTKTRDRDSVGFNKLQIVPFLPISSAAASQTGNTIQAAITLPFSCKILGASINQGISTYTAATGANFNVVAGIGTYETAAGVRSTITATVAGTIASGQVLTVVFYVPLALAQAIGVSQANYSIGLLGIPVVAGAIPMSVQVTLNATTGASATTAATAIVAAINSNGNVASALGPCSISPGLSQLIFASNAAGVITFSSVQASTAFNSVTYIASATGTATITASGTFASGTNTTGVTAAINDQYEYVGAYNFAPSSSAALGATPIFNADMPILPVLPFAGTPPRISSSWDAVYQQGTQMTLRIIGTTLTYTSLVCAMMVVPFDVLVPNPTLNTFDPNLDLG